MLTEDGKASAMRIGDRSFNVILKATNKNDPQDTAKKNVTVTVKGNTDKYPELFKKSEQSKSNAKSPADHSGMVWLRRQF